MEEERPDKHSDHPARDSSLIMLLSTCFCGVIGLLVTGIIGIPLPFTLVFIALIAVGLPCGLSRLARRQKKVGPILISAIVAIILSPVCLPVGLAIGFHILLIPSKVKQFLTGPDVVQSVFSPDQNFEAYVVEKPSIDPPNQSLFIQRSDGIHFRSIAKLAGDIDSIRQIHWSPQSDVVVFQTRCNLFAVRVPGYQTVRIPLGGEWIRAKASKRSTFSGAGPRVEVADIRFPEPGSFSYRLEGVDTGRTIRMDAL